MDRIRWVAIAATIVMAPGVALADGSSAHSAAVKQCRTEQQQMAAAFKTTYGTNTNKSNAFGKCVSHRMSQNTSDQQSAQTSAEQQCRSEQSQDASAFKTKYGTNHNGANAFGMCVSQTARSMSSQDESSQVSAEDNGARQCRAEHNQDPAMFKDKYGTNRNKSNAFGKCVSQKAKAQEQQQQSGS